MHALHTYWTLFNISRVFYAWPSLHSFLCIFQQLTLLHIFTSGNKKRYLLPFSQVEEGPRNQAKMCTYRYVKKQSGRAGWLFLDFGSSSAQLCISVYVLYGICSLWFVSAAAASAIYIGNRRHKFSQRMAVTKEGNFSSCFLSLSLFM